MNLKQYYITKFPDDDLGSELNSDATASGLLNVLFTGDDVYKYLGVDDSVIRERMFEILAEELGTSYEYVYNLWVKKQANYLAEKDVKDLNLNELLKEVWDALIEAREDANYELYNDNSPGAKEHWTSKITNLTRLSNEILRRIEKV